MRYPLFLLLALCFDLGFSSSWLDIFMVRNQIPDKKYVHRKPASEMMIWKPKKCLKKDMDDETRENSDNLLCEPRKMFGNSDFEDLTYAAVQKNNHDLIKNMSVTFLKRIGDLEEKMNATAAKVKSDLEELQELYKSKIFEQMSNRCVNAMDIMQTGVKTIENVITKMKENEQKDFFTSECEKRMKSYEMQILARDEIVMYTSLLLWMNTRGRRVDSASPTTTQTGSKRTEGSPDYQLKWSQPVEDAICVITFHTETNEAHVSTTRSVFETFGETPPKIFSQVVHEHSDIPDLPGCRVYLVYVDFNNRNVILEDPDKGLGSLRLTTIRSLLQFGGDVTVIYCGDKSSRSLASDLYSSYLTSVNSQPELKMLKSKRRMLSIDRDFSEYQKQHCRGYIKVALLVPVVLWLLWMKRLVEEAKEFQKTPLKHVKRGDETMTIV